MAVLKKIREIWRSEEEPKVIVPAPYTTYHLRTLVSSHLDEVCRLNRRCFPLGDSYTRHTFNFLLSEPNGLAICALNPDDKLVAFIVTMEATSLSSGFKAQMANPLGSESRKLKVWRV